MSACSDPRSNFGLGFVYQRYGQFPTITLVQSVMVAIKSEALDTGKTLRWILTQIKLQSTLPSASFKLQPHCTLH